MKIAVTGANGHVGTCLIRLLLKENHEVQVLVHSGSRANVICFRVNGKV